MAFPFVCKWDFEKGGFHLVNFIVTANLTATATETATVKVITATTTLNGAPLAL